MSETKVSANDVFDAVESVKAQWKDQPPTAAEVDLMRRIQQALLQVFMQASRTGEGEKN